MLEDTFEGMEDDDLEEAAQEEVDKVLFEVTKGNETLIYLFSQVITIIINTTYFNDKT